MNEFALILPVKQTTAITSYYLDYRDVLQRYLRNDVPIESGVGSRSRGWFRFVPFVMLFMPASSEFVYSY